MSETVDFHCGKCGHTFHRVYGVEINGLAVLYCNRCGQQLKVDFSTGWSPIPDCSCGGTFSADSLGRCPQCGKSLSEEDKTL